MSKVQVKFNSSVMDREDKPYPTDKPVGVTKVQAEYFLGRNLCEIVKAKANTSTANKKVKVNTADKK